MHFAYEISQKKRPKWFTYNFYSFEVAPKLTKYSCRKTSWLQNMTKSVWYVLKSLVWAQPCICPLLQWQQAFCLWNLTKKRPIWFTHNCYSFEVALKLTTDSCRKSPWLQNMTKSVWYVLKSLVWAQPCICPDWRHFAYEISPKNAQNGSLIIFTVLKWHQNWLQIRVAWHHNYKILQSQFGMFWNH